VYRLCDDGLRGDIDLDGILVKRVIEVGEGAVRRRQARGSGLGARGLRLEARGSGLGA
jgi:hypothetical protein